MYIMIVLLVLLLTGLVTSRAERYKISSKGEALMFFSGGAIVLYLITVGISQVEQHAEIAAFRAVQEQAIYGRDNPSNESVAFQLRVSEKNEWLAKAQYYNSIIDWYYPDEVMHMNPIM